MNPFIQGIQSNFGSSKSSLFIISKFLRIVLESA